MIRCFVLTLRTIFFFSVADNNKLIRLMDSWKDLVVKHCIIRCTLHIYTFLYFFHSSFNLLPFSSVPPRSTLRRRWGMHNAAVNVMPYTALASKYNTRNSRSRVFTVYPSEFNDSFRLPWCFHWIFALNFIYSQNYRRRNWMIEKTRARRPIYVYHIKCYIEEGCIYCFGKQYWNKFHVR